MKKDYNTSRKKLALPEYGRHIHLLVDHIKNIADRDERNRAAQELINIMGNLNPQLRDVADFKHKLWDHLYVIANFELDIDSPYPVPTRESLNTKPRKVSYPQTSIKYKHYGKITEQIAKSVANFEEGAMKDALIEQLANIMKKQYLTWNRESVNDESIFKDLSELTKGKINIHPDSLKLSETKAILSQKNKMHNKNNQQNNKNRNNHNKNKNKKN
ncbi:MAG TPA: DUF4290 domain-containing protein [Bacteroidales bacterium]|nr:DUF4290 domain-containing protein [Bacteroidales bacterium]